MVRLTPRAAPLPCDAAVLERVTAAAFGQRRKMLRQALKALGRDTAKLLDAASLDGTMRGEEIDIAGFVALANAYMAASHPAAGE